MRAFSLFLLVALLAGSPAPVDADRADPQHVIFFNRDRHRIAEASFLEAEAIVGPQLKYTWRELEPERDRFRLNYIFWGTQKPHYSNQILPFLHRLARGGRR